MLCSFLTSAQTYRVSPSVYFISETIHWISVK